MKLPSLFLPVRSGLILGCLVALSYLSGRAQTTPPATAATTPAPVAQRLDVFFGETKLLPIDRPIDDFSVSPDNIVRVTKVDGAPNQLSMIGLAGGSATLTVKSDNRTLLYDVAVSPAPDRLYINLNESKRLTFPDPIDDTNLSQAGIVRIVQPDTANNILLVEADTAGKSTLTVYCKGQIYRYFISTFENRGADVLEIQNSFSAKGYRNLTITFDKDQAVIGGTIPTQEELDDAVRIVKQFTAYVVVKAALGQEMEQSEYSQEESIIINNIQRIANVPGLTVRVKFPAPTVITTSTYTKSAGDYVAPEVTTTPQGGTVRGAGFNPPVNPNQPGGLTNAPLEPKPQQNTTEVTTTTRDTSIPEKIFLYGDLQDDLQEAKAVRVARTFCPFIVSFLTVKDPIQLRTQVRFMQVLQTKSRNTGVAWTGGGANQSPTVTLGFGGSSFQYLANLSAAQSLTDLFTGSFGVGAVLDAQAQLELYENLSVAKLMRETQLFLTNGQPGWYSEGEVRSYISSSSITASSPPIQTLTASAIFLGVNLDISPLNLFYAGGTEPAGQKIFGIPSTIGTEGGAGYTLEQNSDQTPDAVSRLPKAIQKSGSLPFIDNTVKYVDENGLIGINVSTQLSIPNGTFQTVSFGQNGAFISLPDFFVRTTRTRVNLRDGQTVVINGLIDEQTTRSITSVPFLSTIPIFSALFKNPVDFNTRQQVIVLVTPHIIRMRDANSARYPKPEYPEMTDLARERGDVPIIKPVRYDARSVDLRPESPKDMKDGKNATVENEPGPLTPHASGGMQTLQPPADATPATPGPTPHPIDNAPPATDNSLQPSTPSPTLAPPSTLP